ncbi:unannotated protein [freshwater metagenome]|uniref:Unannotated protein n=1 Tax=freshwater metagenome TaxID=449393 RepID=A0A6J7FKJ0_9ZZZZ
MTGHQRIDGSVLQCHADSAPHLVGIFDHVEASHVRGARCGPQQGGEHAYGGALAGTVRAEEAEHLTGVHLQVDAIDGFDIAEVAHEALGVDGELVAERCVRHCAHCA